MHGGGLGEDLVGAGLHAFGDGEVWPEGGARKKPGQDGVATGGVEGGTAGEFGRDDAEAFFELSEVPAFAAKDADLRFRCGDGVTLARNGLDEGGFAAVVGTEDGDVFAGVDGEVDVVEDDVVAARYIDVGQVKERWHCFKDIRAKLSTTADGPDWRGFKAKA